MSVFRVSKTKNYTVMANHHLNDKSLSLKSKGLLSVMLSLPDDWDYTINGLCAICLENESAVKSALKELGEHGYLRVDKIMPGKSKTGRIEYEYNIFEQPSGKQGVENLPVENQPVENPGQLNTKELSTKESSTKDNIPPVTTNVVTSPKGERTPLEDEKKTTKDDDENHRSSSLAGTPKGNPSPHIPRAPSPCDERFEQFWEVYPRKVGKGAARKAFAKIKPSEELLKRMVVAVVAQSKSTAWMDEGGRYIPSPSRWLNEERWEDEINPTGKPPKGPMTDEEWRRNGW